MAIKDVTHGRISFTCLSTDTKPTQNVIAGSKAYETDATGDIYYFNGADWLPDVTPTAGGALPVAQAGASGTTARDTFTGIGNGDAFSLTSLPANIGIRSSSDHSGTTTVKLQYSPDDGTAWNDTGTTFSVTGASDSDMFATITAPYLTRFVCTAFGSAGTVYSYTES